MPYRYKTLTFNDAKARVSAYDSMNDAEFADLICHWSNYDVSKEDYDATYKPFREVLISAFKSALNETSGKMSYLLDLRMGIKLYQLMNPEDGFTNIQANDDDIWRYISVCVMPDITFIRYPNRMEDVDTIRESIPNLSYAIPVKTEKDSLRLKKKRFYTHTRRIWLKTLWWYIHLSWQGDAETTFNVLKNNGTNIISHLIERPGRGYRPALFRSMMYAYSTLPTQKDTIFRAAAKMNLAKCVTVEPALTTDGERGYSQDVFNEIMMKGNHE